MLVVSIGIVFCFVFCNVVQEIGREESLNMLEHGEYLLSRTKFICLFLSTIKL